ncbi:MAG: hypothetical protein OEY89_10135 [Gammaproteobacteria bacterium]|nr:hypothetical protein [Gammaproteobacteria bacterium]
MNNASEIETHMKAFAEAFVLEGRKDTWISLLCNRPDDIAKRALKLFNYLDHNYIEQDDSLKCIDSHETMGVYYDFHREPKYISLKEAVEEAKNHDAIFSMVPGKSAIYFYHEGWNFVCQR